MIKRLYLFDFDGTITKKDSFIDFFVQTFGYRHLLIVIIKNLPKVLSLIIRRDLGKLKEFLTSIFLIKKNEVVLFKLGNDYLNNHFDELMNSVAVEEILRLQKNKENTLLIVSASLDLWLSHFAKKLKVKLICTQLEYKNETFTGNFKTKNCKGPEKVSRIKQVLSLEDFNEIIVYGDSDGDKEMLQLGTKTFYKPFRE